MGDAIALVPPEKKKEEPKVVPLKMERVATNPPTYVVLAGTVTHHDIPEPYAYIVAADGYYIKRENFFYSSLFKIDKNPSLGKADVESVSFDHTIQIPLEIFQEIERLFAEIYKKYQSEAAVILWRNNSNQWSFQIPEQTISAASVNYTAAKKSMYYIDGTFVEVLPGENWKQLGSIHSHAAMSAFHSGVDDKDEYNFDGIHITIGNFNSASRSYSCRYMFGDAALSNRKMADVVAGWVEEASGDLYPTEVLALFQKPAATSYSYPNYQVSSTGKSSQPASANPNTSANSAVVGTATGTDSAKTTHSTTTTSGGTVVVSQPQSQQVVSEASLNEDEGFCLHAD